MDTYSSLRNPTSSTSTNPDSHFHGNEDEFGYEWGFNYETLDVKQPQQQPLLPKSPDSSSGSDSQINHSLLLDSSSSHDGFSKVTDEKENETLDVKQLHQFPTSADSVSRNTDDRLLLDSYSLPYDPIRNYLSHRPKFLMYDPNRHRAILARYEKLRRIMKSDRISLTEDESNEGFDCSAEETLEIVEELAGKTEEHEDEQDDEKEFDEFGYDNQWSLNVLFQYVMVMVVLILMTVFISSMNSPPLSRTESALHGFNFSEIEEAFGPSMLTVSVNGKEINKVYKNWDEETPDAYGDELRDLETVETKETDDIRNMEIEEIVVQENSSYQWQEPVILMSKKLEIYHKEAERGAVLIEILKPVVDQDNCNKSLHKNDIESKENLEISTKFAYFDPFFAAISSSAIAFLMFASVAYFSMPMHTKIYSTNSHTTEVFDESFCSKSIMDSEYHQSTNDSTSSNRTKYFSTADSASYGNFTTKRMIIRKQRVKTPEVMVTTVRRSSRIHNRSIMSA